MLRFVVWYVALATVVCAAEVPVEQCLATDPSCNDAGRVTAGAQALVESVLESDVPTEGDLAAREKNETEVLVHSTGSIASRVALVACMFGAILTWIGAVIKFAIDGSLPARLALWGLLPEVCAAVSVKSLIQLLRLKTDPTPAIVLRNCVTDEGAVRLADAMREYGQKCCLEVIDLPHNPAMGEAGLRAIVAAGMEKESLLQELDLSYNPQFGDAAVLALLPLIESKTAKLNVLKLAGCGITPIGLKGLAEAFAKSKLRQLDLGRNELADSAELIETILEAPVLEELNLACCDLTTSDVVALAEQLPYTSLRSLQLGGNAIGSEGLKALAQHLPKSQVDEIGLEHNEIANEDLSALGTAWAKRPFARVSLKGNRCSQEQVQAFIKTLKSMH